MVVAVRRFATLCALGLWVGGTTLYTAFVVKIAHRVIPGGRFGRVTAEVTGILQAFAAAALGILLVDLRAGWKTSGQRLRWAVGIAWLTAVACLAAEIVLRRRLLMLMDSPDGKRDGFDFAHEAYEMATAIQWFAAMVLLFCVPMAWRRADVAGEAAG